MTMTRNWWLKAALFGLLTGVAIIVVLPYLVPQERLPSFLAKYGRRMIPAVDGQGGLRFVYEVDVDRVLSARLDLLARDLEQRLREELTSPT